MIEMLNIWNSRIIHKNGDLINLEAQPTNFVPKKFAQEAIQNKLLILGEDLQDQGRSPNCLAPIFQHCHLCIQNGRLLMTWKNAKPATVFKRAFRGSLRIHLEPFRNRCSGSLPRYKLAMKGSHLRMMDPLSTAWSMNLGRTWVLATFSGGGFCLGFIIPLWLCVSI